MIAACPQPAHMLARNACRSGCRAFYRTLSLVRLGILEDLARAGFGGVESPNGLRLKPSLDLYRANLEESSGGVLIT
jgi:hypothetical protein